MKFDIERLTARGVVLSDQLDAEGFTVHEQVPLLGGAMLCALLAMPPDKRKAAFMAHAQVTLEALDG